MQAVQGDYFLKRDYAFYDSGVLTVVNVLFFTLLELLRRYTWRSERTGHPNVRKLYKEGILAAHVSQDKLAEHLGVTREHTNRALSQLKKMGWVQTVQVGVGSLIYKLGYVRPDDGGEVFFADVWMQRLWGRLEEASIKEFGQPEGAGGEDPLSDLAYRHLLVRQLPMPRRQEVIRAFIEETRVAGGGRPEREADLAELAGELEPAPGEAEDTTEHLSKMCGPNHKVVMSTSQSLCGPHHRRTRELQTREPETREPLSGGLGEREKNQVNPEEKKNCAKRKEEVLVPALPPPVRNVEETHAVMAAARERAEAEQRARAEKALQKAARDQQRAKNLNGKPRTKDHNVQLARLEEILTGGLRKLYPGVEVAKWGPKEKRQADQLLSLYSFEVVEGALEYLTDMWPTIQTRFKVQIPTLGWLLAIHGALVPESQRFSKVSAVLKTYKQWTKDHPTSFPPSDLRRQYEAIKPELQSLGLVK